VLERDANSYGHQQRHAYQPHHQHGLSSTGTDKGLPYGVRDSFMRSSVSRSPAYDQHVQMMQLAQPGQYQPALTSGYGQQYNQPSVGFAQVGHYPQHDTTHISAEYRRPYACGEYERGTGVADHGAMTEAHLYGHQVSGLQPAFEHAANVGWQYAPQAHMVHGASPPYKEDFETGWHAGHYSSPTHLLGQELYASVPETAQGFEHPAFLRPAELMDPHHRDEKPHTMDTTFTAPAAGDEPQLIASDASAIPPPLPIEKSAHPLAALATDLVWEAFLTAANHNSPASSSSSHFSNNSSERSPSSGRSKAGSSPATSRYSLRSSVSPTVDMFKRSSSKAGSPYGSTWNRSRSGSAGPDAENASSNVFGAIGGERKPRLSLESSPGSDSSSPASTAPGTPAMDQWMMSDAAHNGRLGGQGYWSEDEVHGSEMSKQSLPSISSLLRPAAPQRFGGVTPPYALFDQIQKLLSATLLSQQVLVLALYYVTRVPHTSPLYPPATSQSALQSTSAPFKLLLAALVVANKHLDDNSFRNSTFSQVSNITLPEVNALEYSLLAGLNFDLNVDTPAWLAWLHDLQVHQTTSFVVAQASSPPIIAEIIRGVEVQREQQALANEQGKHAVSLSCDVLASPSSSRRTRKTSLFDLPLTPRSESSTSGGFDLDASGPIEQRPRYNKQVVLPPIPYSNAPSFAACGTAYKYSGGQAEFDYPGRMMMA